MALKTIIKNLTDVAEPLRDLYTKQGDSYVLDIDDKDYKAKLDEFRNNNIDLRKKVESLTEAEKEAAALKEQMGQYKDIDPERAREAIEKMSAIEEQKLIEAGRIDEVVEERIGRRLERLKSDYDGRIHKLESELENSQGSAGKYRERLEDVLINSSLQNAVMEVGTPKKGALVDIINRGKSVWTLDDDSNPLPKADGEVIYGKDGKQPITMEEWARSLLMDSPFLFEGSAGGGANGNLGVDSERGVISRSNQDALNDNIEAIAKGDYTIGE